MSFSDTISERASRARSPACTPAQDSLARELEIARKIQDSLLPARLPPLEGLTLAGFCRSARQVGGDFYDVMPFSESAALVVVADVMGKGVPAALFAATVRTLIRATAEWTREPGQLLARINRLMHPELSAVDMFITVQAAVVDTRRGSITVASAGHCPLLLAQNDGRVQAIAPEGVPIGILPSAAFAETTLPLHDCSVALLYTDGLTDTRNAKGDFFGQQRLAAWVNQASRSGETADRMAEDLKAELHRFQGEAELSDDQTFTLLMREKPSVRISPRDFLESLPVLAVPALAKAKG